MLPQRVLFHGVLLQWNPLYGHPFNTVSFVPTKSSYIFSYISPVDTDNGLFSVTLVTHSRTKLTSLYGHRINYLMFSPHG